MGIEQAAELAGFFAAHGVWCVSDGETLIPMLAFQMADGSRKMDRLVSERPPEAVAKARDWLANNPEKVSNAALVFDGFVTLKAGKTDALLVEARSYDAGAESFTMAVPYRPAKDPDGFAVFRPKLLEYGGAQPTYNSLVDAFFAGVDAHEKGAAIWNKYMDQSR